MKQKSLWNQRYTGKKRNGTVGIRGKVKGMGTRGKGIEQISSYVIEIILIDWKIYY